MFLIIFCLLECSFTANPGFEARSWNNFLLLDLEVKFSIGAGEVEDNEGEV